VVYRYRPVIVNHTQYRLEHHRGQRYRDEHVIDTASSVRSPDDIHRRTAQNLHTRDCTNTADLSACSATSAFIVKNPCQSHTGNTLASVPPKAFIISHSGPHPIVWSSFFSMTLHCKEVCVQLPIHCTSTNVAIPSQASLRALAQPLFCDISRSSSRQLEVPSKSKMRKHRSGESDLNLGDAVTAESYCPTR